jgi:hypothetical protein
VLTRRKKHQAALTAQEVPINIAKLLNQRIDMLTVESQRFHLGNDLFFQPVTPTLSRETERDYWLWKGCGMPSTPDCGIPLQIRNANRLDLLATSRPRHGVHTEIAHRVGAIDLRVQPINLRALLKLLLK